MKLLDPLNGIKFSQMHFMWHLTMFFAMYLVDTEILSETLQQNHKAHSVNINDHPIVIPVHHEEAASHVDLQSLMVHEPSAKDRVLSKIKKRHFQDEIDEGLVEGDMLDEVLSFSGHGSGAGSSSNWKLMSP